MQSSVGSLVSGAVFGAGLTVSGVASPQVIRDQFRMTDFHMLVTFLTASASSAAIIAAYNARSNKHLPSKSSSSLDWIGKYDGNIIGGAMVGLGMSLTGACPGTVLVQATAGVGKSRLLTSSALVAGVSFMKMKQSNLLRHSTSNQSKHTVMSATGWSVSKTILIYEAVMVTTMAMALVFASRSTMPVHPVIGGLLIGLGQMSSVLLAKKPVGLSSAYEDVGKIACDALDGRKTNSVPDSIVFAAGLIAGAGLMMSSVPSTLEVLIGGEQPSLLSTLVGGFVLVFGARMAGGCTSGHGISGMAGMGLSSFITVASMFGTGILASLLAR